MSASLYTRPSASAPILMSLAALAVVVGQLAFFGSARQADEGAAAHLFQLLIVGQLPIMAFFAYKWLRRTPRGALFVLATQVLAGMAACAPVWYFHL